MDKLWSLRFTSMFPIPGNQIAMFFDDEARAIEIFEGHAKRLEMKPDDIQPTLIFDDLMGRQCLRSSFFPHCTMVEIGPCDVAYVEIKKKCEESQRAAGIIQNVGFQAGSKGEAA